jgi:hypothetical protein
MLVRLALPPRSLVAFRAQGTRSCDRQRRGVALMNLDVALSQV